MDRTDYCRYSLFINYQNVLVKYFGIQKKQRTMRRFQKSTIRDVAKESGVSITTVSHFVKGVSSSCSPETAARITAAIATLQYTPNSLSQSLHQKGTGIIGVGIEPPRKQVRSVFAEQVWFGISQAANEMGIALLQFPSQVRDNLDCTPFLGGQIDGLILSEQSDNTRLDTLERAGLPTVAISRSQNIPEGTGAVYASEQDTVRLALDHLFALGHKRIAHVAGPAEVCPVEKRMFPGISNQSDIAVWRRDEFQAEMKRRTGIAPLVSGGIFWTHQEDAVDILKMWIALPHSQRPTALFCGNDQIAYEMILAATQCGLRVPEDLSIMGVDNAHPLPNVPLRLTTIEVPAFDIGYESLYCLKRLLSGAPMEQCHMILPVVHLISGESTVPPPA
jgi:DNA-binding LacI/PurR family transcriptional regulator